MQKHSEALSKFRRIRNTWHSLSIALLTGLFAVLSTSSALAASISPRGDAARTQLSGSSTTATLPIPGPLCTQTPTHARNVLTSCDQPQAPHDETAVVANPLNPLNLVASANDFQEASATSSTQLSRAHVSFDGGQSWANYLIPYPAGCTGTGDPSLGFDATGTVYLTTLCGDTGTVLLTSSTDGGKTWANQTTVSTGAPTLFNDHPNLAVWGHGNVVITWIPYYYTDTTLTQVATVPTVATISHDGGQHFGPIQNISGTSPQCVGLSAPHACDQTWGNAVTVANGNVYVTFFNTTQYRPDGGTNLGRNTHFSVRLNPVSGAPLASPSFIGLAYDGITTGDYPTNTFGRQTMQDSQLRILMQGNITADPTNSNHVAVVWFDDRNAVLPVNPNPYVAHTNSDIIVSQSFNAGATWSTPQAIRQAGDQFFPWAAYDNLGRLQIGYFDRSYDPANHQYGYTLASETHSGSLAFNRQQLTTQLSDPTRDNRWFTTTVDTRFPNATFFLGDYSGIAIVGNSVVSVWTDQRLQSCLFSVCGHGQDTFAAVVRL